jgi:mono/diheme cytochrome c family protein
MIPGKKYVAAAGGVLLSALVANYSFSDEAPAAWEAPARAAAKKNPVAADADSLAAGKKVYASNCLACHGEKGKGDGPASAAVNPKPHDLAEEAVKKQSDGALFWKLTEGRKPMPAYDKTLSETERWQVINYVRTLGK